MEVIIENLQKKVRINSTQIRQITKTILRRERIKRANISIVFVTHQKISALNKIYLNRSYATDVLAFDLSEGKKSSRQELVADIIISTDAAVKNSKMYGQPLSRELALYIIHGILHILGFDDHGTKKTNQMRKKEQELLKFLGSKTKTVVW